MKKKRLRRMLLSLLLLPLLPIIGGVPEGGTAGDNGAGGVGSSGDPQGTGSDGGSNAVTFNAAQTEEMNRIVSERAKSASESALKDYFKKQGMTQEETEAALNAYREEQKKRTTKQVGLCFVCIRKAAAF